MSGNGRLDSWKDIAAHLGRDVRTVKRWEGSRALPVRRIPGGGRASVFAYAAEIDDWLTKEGAIVEPEPQSTAPTRSRRTRPIAIAAGVIAILGACGWMWWNFRTSSESPVRIELEKSAIVAYGASGTERWRVPFPQGEIVVPPNYRPEAPGEIGGPDDPVLVAVAQRFETSTKAELGGQMFWFSPSGDRLRTFFFDDHVTFDDQEYRAPWVISDFRVSPHPERPRRIALVAHHMQWWPGLLTILDGAGERQGTFVNDGWVDRVHWLSSTRVLISGFSEAFNGGMVALLDASALDGRSPELPGSGHACQQCGPARPLRYVVLPRSELNAVTASPFNRARIQMVGDRITVRTIEVPDQAGAIDAIYEFTPALDLVSATYSGRYWDLHRALEARGTLREHSRDSDGPRSIVVWEPATGWRTIKK